MTQALVSAAAAELGDVELFAGDVADGDVADGDVADGDVADDAGLGAAWLAHAVMPSPHAATAKKLKVTVRSRTM